MNKDPSGHVAAAVTFEDGGKTYVLTPVTIAGLRELEEDLKTRCIEAVTSRLDKVPASLHEFLVGRAYEDMKAIQVGTAAFDRAAQGVDGMTTLAHIMLRARHPELGRADVMRMLTEQAEALAAKVKAAAGYKPDPTPGPGEAATARAPTSPSSSAASTAP